MITHYEGDDLSYSIKKPIDIGFENLDSYAEIIVTCANGARTVRFSKTIKSGYTQLIRVSQYEYKFEPTSSDTAYLGTGNIRVGICFIVNADVKDNRLNKEVEAIAFKLLPSLNKNER